MTVTSYERTIRKPKIMRDLEHLHRLDATVRSDDSEVESQLINALESLVLKHGDWLKNNLGYSFACENHGFVFDILGNSNHIRVICSEILCFSYIWDKVTVSNSMLTTTFFGGTIVLTPSNFSI